MKRSHLQATLWILVALLHAAAPAGAITINPSFETGDTSGWTTSGHVSVVTDTFGVPPEDGLYQLLMTTDAAQGAASPATTESDMGLSPNTIDKIFKDQVQKPGQSRAKDVFEGSAIQQSFEVVAVGDLIAFEWNFLTDEFTRDPLDTDLYTDFLWGYLDGPRPSSAHELVFAHANQGAGSFTDSDSVFDKETGYQTFSFTFTETGTYTLTLGVHDIEDSDHNAGAVFDFFRLIKGPEPNTFLLLASGLLGLHWYARRHKALR
jgi:hypothetical protein